MRIDLTDNPLLDAWVGIDPGQKGAWGLVAADGTAMWEALPTYRVAGQLQIDGVTLLGQLRAAQARFKIVQVGLERPFLVKGQGGKLTVGLNYGRLLQTLQFAELDFKECEPLEWQGRVLAGLVGPDPKERALRRVQREFPDLDLRKRLKRGLGEVHDGAPDALCIAMDVRALTGGGS